METLITKVSSEQRLEGNRGPVSIILFFKKQMEEAGKQPPPSFRLVSFKNRTWSGNDFFFFFQRLSFLKAVEGQGVIIFPPLFLPGATYLQKPQGSSISILNHPLRL